ncbi:hypothetical protein GCM10007301_39780 [Azorhizobium oxalatiphilum]|uniref:Uncharacterized protein n=1 Tax=Azorhizobium oxalatiphilum TaxID=980631 RepID=A0A917FEH4_9HYPH|nr:hypothetical protein [Azorhizobium oxalatiphilum]GGF75859.1 hypothetical protein GCM10007301_39780 [Azorhizobium oxalatiphilum]
MTRTFLAFLVAPLWIPLLAAVSALLWPDTRNPLGLGGMELVWRVALVAAVVGYGACWSFGLGLFFFLRAQGWRSVGITALAWFVAGMVLRLAGFILGWVQFLSMHGTLRELSNALATRPLFFVWGGVLAMLVGLTVRAIAGPAPEDNEPDK